MIYYIYIIFYKWYWDLVMIYFNQLLFLKKTKTKNPPLPLWTSLLWSKWFVENKWDVMTPSSGVHTKLDVYIVDNSDSGRCVFNVFTINVCLCVTLIFSIYSNNCITCLHGCSIIRKQCSQINETFTCWVEPFLSDHCKIRRAASWQNIYKWAKSHLICFSLWI